MRPRRGFQVVGVVVLAAAMGCAAESTDTPDPAGLAPEGTEFPAWSIPVPPDTPVRGLLPVDEEQRTEDLPLERDLVLTGAFDVPLYDPGAVAVSSSGDIYAIDTGNHRVVAFDPRGEPLRSFGRQGQGPGEFQDARRIAVVGDRVLVHDDRNNRWSAFDLDGRHLADHGVPNMFQPESVVGAGDELLLIDRQPVFVPLPRGEELPPSVWRVGRYGPDATLGATLVELQRSAQTYWILEGRAAGSVPLRAAAPAGAITADGSVYVTPGDEYQVLALRPDGSARWALRVAYRAPAPTEEVKDAIVSLVRERTPEIVESAFVWPERLATVENLEVDAAGYLYVFLHSGRDFTEAREIHRPVPVDVYSPEGDRVFAGWSPVEDWDTVRDDAIYRIETDPETAEPVVARYRLTGTGYRER